MVAETSSFFESLHRQQQHAIISLLSKLEVTLLD